MPPFPSWSSTCQWLKRELFPWWPWGGECWSAQTSPPSPLHTENKRKVNAPQAAEKKQGLQYHRGKWEHMTSIPNSTPTPPEGKERKKKLLNMKSRTPKKLFSFLEVACGRRNFNLPVFQMLIETAMIYVNCDILSRSHKWSLNDAEEKRSRGEEIKILYEEVIKGREKVKQINMLKVRVWGGFNRGWGLMKDEREVQLCEAFREEIKGWNVFTSEANRHDSSPLMGAPKQLATPTAAATTNISSFSLRKKKHFCSLLKPLYPMNSNNNTYYAYVWAEN